VSQQESLPRLSDLRIMQAVVGLVIEGSCLTVPVRRVARHGFRFCYIQRAWHAEKVNSDPSSQSLTDVTSFTPIHLHAIHGSFALPLDLAAPRGRVYAAYADPALRRRWFRIPSTPEHAHHELDFRVGGHEIARGVFAPSGAEERRDGEQDMAHLKGGTRLQLNGLAAALSSPAG
jgi:hypothetical protein